MFRKGQRVQRIIRGYPDEGMFDQHYYTVLSCYKDMLTTVELGPLHTYAVSGFRSASEAPSPV